MMRHFLVAAILLASVAGGVTFWRASAATAATTATATPATLSSTTPASSLAVALKGALSAVPSVNGVPTFTAAAALPFVQALAAAAPAYTSANAANSLVKLQLIPITTAISSLNAIIPSLWASLGAGNQALYKTAATAIGSTYGSSNKLTIP